MENTQNITKKAINLLLSEAKDLKDKYNDKVEIINEDLLFSSYSYNDKEELLAIKDFASDVLGDYNIVRKIDDVLKKMKEIAYPEVNGVKYYKKYIDQLKTNLTIDEKLYIDEHLKRSFNPRYIMCSLFLDRNPIGTQKVLRELYELGVIAPTFTFDLDVDCYCDDDKTEHLGNVEYGKTIYEHFGVCNDNDLIEKLKEKHWWGCNNCDIEANNTPFNNDRDKFLSEIKEAYSDINIHTFKVILEPDLTIDKL